MTRLVLFMFAGRRANMEVQMPYLIRILDTHPGAELHLWDLTRDPADQMYLRGLRGARNGRVQVWDTFHDGHPIMCLYPRGALRRRGSPPCTCLLHKPPYEKVYQTYAEADKFNDMIYVKVDDDILFLETDRFDDLIHPLADHPERVISASVVNNAVCAKYRHDNLVTANKFAVGDPVDPKNDRRWWALHESAEFAQWCHDRFIDDGRWGDSADGPPSYVRTRPGEAVSINCIAFTHLTMRRMARMMDNGLGDEGAVDKMLPWICLSFTAAHLSFGPQDKAMSEMELNRFRNGYWQLSKEYLR